MNKKEKEALITKFRTSGKRLVLIDYDGTLVNYELIPDNAKLPEHMIDILVKIAGNPRTDIYIISGRSYNDLDKLLGNIPVRVIAEHGTIVKENGQWKIQFHNNSLWKKAIFPALNQMTDVCPGSFTEEKNFSLAWHYRNIEPEIGYECSRKLINILKDLIHSYNLRILDGKKVVEILSTETGKGRAVEKLCHQDSYDFVLSIGDDATDEEMFEYFLDCPDAYSIKVGEGKTLAKFKVNAISDVESLLKQLSL
jgi:trehalose 6-phosphate synthase/phosphatase